MQPHQPQTMFFTVFKLEKLLLLASGLFEAAGRSDLVAARECK